MRAIGIAILLGLVVACASQPVTAASDSDVEKRVTQAFAKLSTPVEIDGELADVELVTTVFVTDVAGTEHKVRERHRPIPRQQAARLRTQMTDAIAAKEAELADLKAKLAEFRAAMRAVP